MHVLDRLALKVKRRDGLVASAIGDVYRWLMRWEVPDTRLVRELGRIAYLAHDAAVEGSEIFASKFLYKPMARGRFAHIGQGVHITALPYVHGHCNIRIGDGAKISKMRIFSGRFYDDPELVIGKNTVIGFGVSFTINQRVTIGDHAGIAGRVTISDSDGHPVALDRRLRGETLSKRDILPVTIGDHVWIGRAAHVQKGVTIGRGAVVAAGTVVVADVPEGALAMGVPARIVASPWGK